MTDRQFFLLQFLSPRGPKRAKKSFSSIERKIIFETVTIYVLRDSGDIIIVDVEVVEVVTPPRVSEEEHVFHKISNFPDHTHASMKGDFEQTKDPRSICGHLVADN